MQEGNQPSGKTPRASTDWRQILQSSLLRRLDIYRSELHTCSKKSSERGIHDLRVATRRLISTLELINTLAHDERIEKQRRQLRRRLKSLNPLRDTQVQILHVQAMIKRFPALEQFLTVLRVRERNNLKRIMKQLHGIDTAAMSKETAAVEHILRSLSRLPAIKQAGMPVLQGALAAAFTRVVARRQEIKTADRSTIHRMRVAFKKFRYMTEAMQPLLGGVTKDRLKKMNAFQDTMGAIQDLEVLTTNLNAYARRSSPALRRSMVPVLQELLRHHHACVQKFTTTADDVYGFWTPALLPSTA